MRCTLRRIINLFNKNKISVSEFASLNNASSNLQTQIDSKVANSINIVTFPFDILRSTPWGTNIFVVFVDPLLGIDSNNGLTLATAKKTIQSALDSLPMDLLGHEAWILLHSGTYSNDHCPGTVPIVFKNKNGSLRICTLSTELNSLPVNPTPSETFFFNLLGGAQVRDNAPIIFTANNLPDWQPIMRCSWDQNNTLKITFVSMVLTKEWDQPGANMAYRYQFFHGTNCSPLSYIAQFFNLVDLYIAHPILVDVKNSQRFGLSFDNITSGRVTGCKMINSSGVISGLQTFVGAWGGLYTVQNCTKKFALETIWYPANSWHPQYPLDVAGKHLIVNGVTQLCTYQGSNGFTHSIGSSMVYNQGLMPNANPPQINIQSSQNDFSISYNSDLATLNDNSTNPHIVTNTKTGFVKQFISAEIAKFGSNLVQQAHTSVIADADLRNKDISFYLDEAGNKLKIKLKYSNGTIKNGEVVLT